MNDTEACSALKDNVLWLSGLPTSCRVSELTSLFSQYGTVKHAKVGISAKSPVSKVFGLMTMSTAQEAALCIEKLNNTEYNGQIISVKLHTKQQSAVAIVPAIVPVTKQQSAISIVPATSPPSVAGGINDIVSLTNLPVGNGVVADNDQNMKDKKDETEARSIDTIKPGHDNCGPVSSAVGITATNTSDAQSSLNQTTGRVTRSAAIESMSEKISCKKRKLDDSEEAKKLELSGGEKRICHVCDLRFDSIKAFDIHTDGLVHLTNVENEKKLFQQVSDLHKNEQSSILHNKCVDDKQNLEKNEYKYSDFQKVEDTELNTGRRLDLERDQSMSNKKKKLELEGRQNMLEECKNSKTVFMGIDGDNSVKNDLESDQQKRLDLERYQTLEISSNASAVPKDGAFYTNEHNVLSVEDISLASVQESEVQNNPTLHTTSIQPASEFTNTQEQIGRSKQHSTG